jgi:regulator of extracellular matrix RemA (YlzA/DUF370 family)
MVNTGFSEVIGSWKIIAISAPRTRRICARLLIERDHLPVAPAQPAALAAHFAAGLFEQAHQRQRGDRFSRTDSPTIASVSPRRRLKRQLTHA